ncbi:NAD(P)-dependent oxidoreductase [Microcystis aeruginosa LEGE 11464]|jgi:nucleoside-diphosphate-sugar epimerase|uniref:NAD-dependent epimerase/dehydratase family protein n=1 Tax=Microcystis TaxID=1125 RepID=UPI00188101A4|nr:MULTISPECIES: NAD(P)-dependent oxidoreductase [Microcystis]MBE9089556.1 NAD(P)-dependent oxidoreductase [Microcystis aeruginosa LEGE 11464]MCA2659732.1 NAD(P)-dependent oxidoreductase [Microcystis sp. M049S2]MCZ8128051.1 NAD(P)-dependent oxidoreductase [Microcystis sp. LE19-114.1B]
MSKTILLTGGTGFLGSHLAKRLVYEGFDVIIIKRSTSKLSPLESIINQVRFYGLDSIDIEKIFQENVIDIIIHCATNYGRFAVPPTDIIQANLFLPLTILQIAENYPVKTFINTDTILDKRVSYYSLSKKHFLDWLSLFSQKMVCISVALEHFYGPFDDRSKFVSKIILDLLHEVDFIDLTLGEQKRDFIYIDDVVEAFMTLVNFSFDVPNNLYRYEIGTGKNIEIREFVQTVKTMTGNKVTRLNFGMLPYRENEIMESHVDISMLSRLGWQPQISLVEGLKYTIDQERSSINR